MGGGGGGLQWSINPYLGECGAGNLDPLVEFRREGNESYRILTKLFF